MQHAAADRRVARVTIVPVERQRAGALLCDRTRTADDARVGVGIRPVEDERAVVRERVYAEHAGCAPNADLERAAGVEVDRAVGAPRERAHHRHEAARHGERADAVSADENADIGPRAAAHRGGADAISAMVAENGVRVRNAAAAHVQRAGASEADVDVAAIGPRAARYRGRADAF